MKIESEKLRDFLDKSRMNEINTCLLSFEEDGLHITAISEAKTHMAKTVLLKKCFTDYAPIGNVGVDELAKLISVIKKLDKEIELSVEGNLMSIKGQKKEVSFELVDEKFIEVPPKFPEPNHTTKIKIDAGVLSSFIKDALTNTDFVIYFETVENGVKLFNSGKYQFKYNLDSEGTTAGVKVGFGEPLVSTLTAIKSGELVCHVKDNYPLLINHNTEDYTMEFMVAPRTEK